MNYSAVGYLSPSISVPRPAAAAMTLFVLIAYAIIGTAPMVGGSKAPPFSGDGDMLRQLSYVAMFGFAMLALRVPQNLKQLLVLPVSVLLLIGWCWISLAWSLEPSIGARRLGLTCILIWTIFLCVEHSGFERAINALRLALLVALVVNYAAVFLLPGGVHNAADGLEFDLIGNWRGILAHKNFAGAVCAVTILTFLYAAHGMRPLLRWVVILAAAYFLFRTQSKTSMGLLAVAILLAGVYSGFGPSYRKLLVPVAAILAGAGLVAWHMNADTIADVFLRPDGFTGRNQIWAMLLNYSGEHPLLGSGYGSFWNIGDNGPVYDYGRGWITKIAQGHNGYLDLVVQIGIPGAILAAFALIVQPLWRLLTNSSVPSSKGALIAAILLFSAGHNLTESTMMDRDMIVQVFLIFAGALASQAARRPPKPTVWST